MFTNFSWTNFIYHFSFTVAYLSLCVLIFFAFTNVHHVVVASSTGLFVFGSIAYGIRLRERSRAKSQTV